MTLLLEEALERIADPLTWMQRDLKPGEVLNGAFAVQMANSAEYLKQIATEALVTHRSKQKAPTDKRSMVITLCGSARFEHLFKAWNEALTMCGHTVFSLTVYPSDKGRKDWYSDEVKDELDAAHFRKIEASDAIFVINRFAYIGESTMREIEHARSLGKVVYFLESWGKGKGISSAHTDEYRSNCESFGLGRNTASPIDTFAHYTNGNRSAYELHLLGPAGATRSAAVKLVQDAEDVTGFAAPKMDSVTPLSDALEANRRAMQQERTPAYGDALALCRRLECALQERVIYSPIECSSHVEKSGSHPNDNEPHDPERRSYLDQRGDDQGQGLSVYWKWGHAAGWNDHKKHMMSQATTFNDATMAQIHLIKALGHLTASIPTKEENE